MKSAAISTLKAALSEYISFVKAGEEILVTERGKPVARKLFLSMESLQVIPNVGNFRVVVF